MSDRHGFDRIIGQDLAKRVLARAVKKNQPAHTYLFLGLQGTGKLTAARQFAKALNCEQQILNQVQDDVGRVQDDVGRVQEDTGFGACEQCAVCHAIEHGNFPDIRVWSPKKAVTTIDTMREMRDMATFRPMRGKWVVNIIEQGDTLNEESANCILKLLEEPPPYLINILLYKNAANILPTIVSRSQLVRFEQVNNDLLAQRLVEEHGVSPEEAEFLATYSQGRPGIAIGLISDTDFQTKRRNITAVAKAAAAGQPWAALRLAEALRAGPQEDAEAAEDDDEAPSQAKAAGARKGVRDATLEALDMLLLWYRDLLAMKTQGESAPIVNVDRRTEIAEQSSRYAGSDFLLSAVGSILHAKRRVQGNAMAQVATEALMVKLCLI